MNVIDSVSSSVVRKLSMALGALLVGNQDGEVSDADLAEFDQATPRTMPHPTRSITISTLMTVSTCMVESFSLSGWPKAPRTSLTRASASSVAKPTMMGSVNCSWWVRTTTVRRDIPR